MGFVKEFRNIREEMPEWEYIDSLGVVNILGRKISKHVSGLVVDRKRNYFLIPQGHTGRRDYDVDEAHFTLCLDGYKVHFELVENNVKIADKTFDYIYSINVIEVVDEDIKKMYTKEEIMELIKESLEVRSISKYFKIGKVEVIFKCDDYCWW